jgi:chemotaxis protein histidine kinase CheA
MNELTEKLFPAFLAEAGEQIEALELALVGAAPAAIDVNGVFRSMHTIKGGCAMMGFAAMEAVAHAAEELLDQARRGQYTLDVAGIDVLLGAVDALKAQLQDASTSRRDPAARAELVAQLRAMATAAASGGATAATATAAPARSEATGARARRKAGATAAPARSGDFAAQSRDRLPTLLAQFLADKTDAAQAAQLAQAATADGMPAVAALFARMATPTSAPERRALAADLLLRLQHAAADGNTDFGTTAAIALLRDQLGQQLSLALELIGGELQALTPGGKPDAALAASEDAQALLALHGLPASVRLFAYMTQLLRDATRRTLALNQTMLDTLRVAAALPADMPPGADEDAPYVAMAEQTLERLREAARTASEGDDRRQLLGTLSERLALRPETLDTLTPAAVQQLKQAVEGGKVVVEVEADMESVPDGGAEFVAWLSAAGTLISNHTVFHRETSGAGEVESTRLRFLAALDCPLAEARRALGELDPQRRWFDLHVCAAPDAPAAAAVSGDEPAAQGSAAPARGAGSATLRIDSTTLDRFVNRVGEMVMLRNMLSHALNDEDLVLRLRRLRHTLGNNAANAAELDSVQALLTDMEARLEHLSQADLRLQGALGRLQEDVLGLRVVPIGMVFNRLPRVVRDLGHAQGKQVELEITGEDVRIDKGMVDVLLEPLMHMVRNSVDHGIETPVERSAAGKPAGATLSLAARQHGNTLLIEVADNGRGLDAALIRNKAVENGLLDAAQAAQLSERELANLIFLPGFSTARQVTAVSGRGVGMDVVKTRITQVGGQIEVQSEPGRGVRFTLRLPLSAAIQNVVLVAAGTRQFALPERNVTEVISITRAQLQHVQGQAACLLRGTALPVYHLDALLEGDTPASGRGDNLEVVVVSDGVLRIGVLVDRVLGRPEVFMRDMHPDLARVPGVGGVSILGDGRVVVILDCEKLFEIAARNAQSLRSLLRAS